MISLPYYMKKLKSNNRLLPRVKQPLGKDSLTLNYSNTKNKTSKGNSKFSWNKEIKSLPWKIKYLPYNLNLLRKNSKSKPFPKNYKILWMSIVVEILKAQILMSMKWKRRSKPYKNVLSSKLSKLFKNKFLSIKKKSRSKNWEISWKNSLACRLLNNCLFYSVV